jgi:DNA-binding NarL/FixJ family response regulator
VIRGADGHRCLEVLLPRWTEPETAGAAVAPTLTHAVLLVEPREMVRAELHKFFEANGYNLIEAANAAEAITLSEMREGALDLVIAPKVEAEQIEDALRDARPNLVTLAIVNEAERSARELRRSYTQAALLERVRVLLQAAEEEAAKETARLGEEAAASQTASLREKAAESPETVMENGEQVHAATAGSSAGE